jgi:hypothetical protein
MTVPIDSASNVLRYSGSRLLAFKLSVMLMLAWEDDKWRYLITSSPAECAVGIGGDDDDSNYSVTGGRLTVKQRTIRGLAAKQHLCWTTITNKCDFV